MARRPHGSGVRAPGWWSSRTGVVVKHALAAGGIKGLALVVTILTLPAYLNLFPERELLGVWLALISVVNWLLTVDLGVGNGVRNSLVPLIARGEAEVGSRQVAGAYGASTLISLVVAVVSWPLLVSDGWTRVIGDLAVDRTNELRLMGAILLGTVLIQFILRVVTFLLYALQLSVLNNLMALGTSVSFLVCAHVLPRVDGVGDIIRVGLAYFVCVNAPLLIGTVAVFAGPLRAYRPRRLRSFLSGAPLVLRLGRSFFYNQVLYTMFFGTSTFLVVALADGRQVVAFQAYMTVFTIPAVLMTLVFTPMWSAITRAVHDGAFGWVRRMMRHLVLAALGVLGAGILLAISAQPIFNVWLGPGVVAADLGTALAFACFAAGFTLHGAVATVASGVGKLRLQALYFSIGVPTKLTLAVAGVWLFDSWVVIPLGDALILTGYGLLERRSLQRWLRSAEDDANARLAGLAPGPNDR